MSRSFMSRAAFPAFSLLLCLSPAVRAADAPAKPADVGGMIADGKYAEADAAVEKLLAQKNDPAVQENLLYLKALSFSRENKDDAALAALDELLKGKPLLEEEARALRAQILEKQGKWKDALAENRRLLELSPNFHLRFEADLREGRSRAQNGKLREARNIFAALEKKSRSTPSHPDVMIELARAERKMGNVAASCKWWRKLYKQHPTHPMLKDWGPDLATDEVDSRHTTCRNSEEDFRDRVRALMWAGEEDKARTEVETIATRQAAENRVGADQLRAWFLLQNGQPDDAYKLLTPSVPSHSADHSFLSVFGSAAARSGNGSAAVGAFHRLFELSPRSEKGRRALFQSAYLSYQFQDYDGANRRFSEFLQKFPRSKLSQDARWNLAWITYLKKDFENARHRFTELASQRRASPSLRDRARYWLAMSSLRLNRPQDARPLFETIAKDRSGSYYGNLARQRLLMIPSVTAVTAGTAKAPSDAALAAAADAGPAKDAAANESDDSLASETDVNDASATTADNDDNSTDAVPESGRTEILQEPVALKAPANAKRFERARTLARLGMTDEARWELFEIERHTHSKEELKSLITAYEEIGQWHRSSTIAQNKFGAARVALGVEGARNLWEETYPRAYASEVKDSAKRNNLPEEFIWGIMRAESSYRRDAVSPVGALGLMQIMPGSARKLASLSGTKDFQPTQLLEPKTAIQLGSYYLKRLSRQFDDSIPLAAAAYNAGPHRVHAWLLAFGSLDMDEFVEHIPFLETREYVRKVVSNALTYASLYKGKTAIEMVTPLRVKGKIELAKRESWEPQ